MRYRVRNLRSFQHYKQRKPPWIKWHRECLDNREFMDLPDEVKWLAVLCVLLATESDDGEFDSETVEWRNRRKFSEKQAQLLVASGVLAPCKQESIPETEEETETETEGEAEKDAPSTPADADDSEPPPVFVLRCTDGEYRVTGSDLEKWRRAYPAVDLMGDMHRAADWCDSNPGKRKTVRGARAFLTRWFTKSQNSGGTKGYNPNRTGPTVHPQSGGVQWRGNQQQQPKVDPARASELAEAIQDTGLTRGYRFKAAEDAIEAHPDEQDMDRLAEIARRCAWDWQREINSEAWKRRQEEGAA